MNPLAPGPLPGTPVFEWHTRHVSCGTTFTDADAERAERLRQEEIEQREIQNRRRLEAQRRVSDLERERHAALNRLPPIAAPSPVEVGVVGQGCGIGCGLWIAFMAVALIVLGATGQLDAEDPTILGVDNPLVFLPAAWLAGWLIALIRLPRVKWKQRAARARADRRDSERARIKADFDRRIAAVEK